MQAFHWNSLQLLRDRLQHGGFVGIEVNADDRVSHSVGLYVHTANARLL